MRTSKEKVEKAEKAEKVDKVEKELREIKKKPKSLGILENFIGKDISINMRGGNSLKGKLESVAQYELIMTMSYKPVIVMKHAVDYIELSDEK